ncbi:MAG TPA: heavy metal-binding domain-containing protein, partial [Bryobacteraceae bacterium]|nr:heavy metal-binding domain-containing protein [Bryobacteraceae bacterium]
TARFGFAQQAPPSTVKPPTIQDAIVQKGASEGDEDLEYMCPMDADVRSKYPGKCPRCGMTLILGMPDPREYIVQVTTTPKILKANAPIQLHFQIEDPDTHKQVQKYEIMHEKLYHLFVVSQDLMFFNHVHPQIQPDGSFNLTETFPHAGVYRMLSDFYPTGGTPQLIATPVMVPGPGFKMEYAKLQPDVSAKDDQNLHVELVTDPPQPLAGFKTMMFFRLTPNQNIEQYIGAWGHMLAASWDLVDMMHTHPIYVTDPDDAKYKQIQFNLIFPRAGIYRVWIQFQRAGVVNTVVYNIPVKNLE